MSNQIIHLLYTYVYINDVLLRGQQNEVGAQSKGLWATRVGGQGQHDYTIYIFDFECKFF